MSLNTIGHVFVSRDRKVNTESTSREQDQQNVRNFPWFLMCMLTNPMTDKLDRQQRKCLRTQQGDLCCCTDTIGRVGVSVYLVYKQGYLRLRKE